MVKKSKKNDDDNDDDDGEVSCTLLVAVLCLCTAPFMYTVVKAVGIFYD